jgi:hypothetical protein
MAAESHGRHQSPLQAVQSAPDVDLVGPQIKCQTPLMEHTIAFRTMTAVDVTQDVVLQILLLRNWMR